VHTGYHRTERKATWYSDELLRMSNVTWLRPMTSTARSGVWRLRFGLGALEKKGEAMYVESGAPLVQSLLKRQNMKCYIFWECVCSHMYPAFNAHVAYCHLWPAALCNIFPHYLTNGKFSEKLKLLNTNLCFDFLYNFYLKHFFDSKKNWTIYDQKCILVFL
jgi:hypothetical protein